MTFLAHSVVGGGLTGSLVGLTGAGRTQRMVGYVSGFVLGGLPDTLDWLLWVTEGVQRWSVYTWFHHDMPAWMQLVLFPTGLHIQMDKLIHLFPGYNWWPDFWYLEVGMWIIGGFLTWAVLRK